jgi:hypothetical protein
VPFGLVALAETNDGIAWLVYAYTKADITLQYGIDTADQLCMESPTSATSATELHVVRAPLDGVTPPKEVMTLPIDSIDQSLGGSELQTNERSLDARAFGTDLAIAFHASTTGYTGKARVLRIDTTTLQ